MKDVLFKKFLETFILGVKVRLETVWRINMQIVIEARERDAVTQEEAAAQ